uniref:Uncharacterized protein n=1 Tax=Helianthus annuus TaxID=4232 RepID=A0A251SHK4_HELAN
MFNFGLTHDLDIFYETNRMFYLNTYYWFNVIGGLDPGMSHVPQCYRMWYFGGVTEHAIQNE